MILWPISIMMVLHRSVILGVDGARTNDFRPVYLAAWRFLNDFPVYAENYDTVDPHYLYPPSGTLVMAPLATLDYEDARWVFIALSTIVLVLSAYLLVRLFGYGIGGWQMPAVLLFFFSTETVTNTLVFTNFNGFVLLGLLGFLLMLRGRHDWWAGVFIGLTIAVKPVLAPLLLLALLNRQWKAIIPAAVVPLALLVIAWPMGVDSADFVHRTLPYLSEVRDYYNSSIAGNGAYFGVADWLVLLLRAAFALMAVFSLWFLYRYYRRTDELLWLTVSSGVLLTTEFLVGSLGQGYYSMLLFPLLASVLLPGSPMRNWPAWLGVYGAFAFDSFYSDRWEAFGRMMEYNKVTMGWSLIMVAVFCSLLFRYLDLRKAGAAGPLLEEWPRRHRAAEDADAVGCDDPTPVTTVNG